MLLYPYYLGMKIQLGMSPILYRGSIEVPLSGWISQEPIISITEFLDYCNAHNTYMYNMFQAIYSSYLHVIKGSMPTIEKYKTSLESRIKYTVLLQNCDSEVYDNIRQIKIPSTIMQKLSSVLQDLDYFIIAAIDMIFRVHELYLKTESLEKVLEYFESRQQLYDGFEGVLVESLIHKILILNDSKMLEYFTDSDLAIQILDLCNPKDADYNPSIETQIDLLSFSIFDYAVNLLRNDKHVINPEKVNKVFLKHADALDKMRHNCHKQALELIDCNKIRDDLLNEKLKDIFYDMREEIEDICNINKDIFKSTYKKVTEDPVLWSTFIGTIVSVMMKMPTIISASASITALSKLGVSALQSHRQRSKFLKESPWSTLYYLK